MKTQQLWLGGRWQSASGDQEIDVVNPAGLEPVARVQLATTGDMDTAIGLARDTFDSGVWRDRSPEARGEVLRDAADCLEKRLPELARLVTPGARWPSRFLRGGHGPH